jgi:hypothetical protein
MCSAPSVILFAKDVSGKFLEYQFRAYLGGERQKIGGRFQLYLGLVNSD